MKPAARRILFLARSLPLLVACGRPEQQVFFRDFKPAGQPCRRWQRIRDRIEANPEVQ